MLRCLKSASPCHLSLRVRIEHYQHSDKIFFRPDVKCRPSIRSGKMVVEEKRFFSNLFQVIRSIFPDFFFIFFFPQLFFFLLF